jgi:hypothetical protein
VNRRRRPIDGESACGFGWLQNAWLLHARLKIHRGGGIDTRKPVCG